MKFACPIKQFQVYFEFLLYRSDHTLPILIRSKNSFIQNLPSLNDVMRACLGTNIFLLSFFYDFNIVLPLLILLGI